MTQMTNARLLLVDPPRSFVGIPPSCECPTGQTWDDSTSTCNCPVGTGWNGSSCASLCPAYTVNDGPDMWSSISCYEQYELKKGKKRGKINTRRDCYAMCYGGCACKTGYSCRNLFTHRCHAGRGWTSCQYKWTNVCAE